MVEEMLKKEEWTGSACGFPFLHFLSWWELSPVKANKL